MSLFFPNEYVDSTYSINFEEFYKAGYRGVIFDIDNTLYCYDTAHTAAMEALHGYARAELGIYPAELDTLLKEKQQQIKAELGDQAAIHNRGIRCLRVLEQLKMPLRHASRMEKLYWNTLISVSAPNPGVLECLKALQAGGSGYRFRYDPGLPAGEAGAAGSH